MSLMDTVDGAFMTQAYGWAFSNPIRKVYYNITVTSLSVTVALAVGSVELLQVVATKFGLDAGFWGWLNALNFENLGYGVVGLFLVTWVCSVVIWKTRRIDERWGGALQPTTHWPHSPGS
jgi:high-affinity nickel-transport protein